jgi:hypothetical protein
VGGDERAQAARPRQSAEDEWKAGKGDGDLHIATSNAIPDERRPGKHDGDDDGCPRRTEGADEPRGSDGSHNEPGQRDDSEREGGAVAEHGAQKADQAVRRRAYLDRAPAGIAPTSQPLADEVKCWGTGYEIAEDRERAEQQVASPEQHDEPDEDTDDQLRHRRLTVLDAGQPLGQLVDLDASRSTADAIGVVAPCAAPHGRRGGMHCGRKRPQDADPTRHA